MMYFIFLSSILEYSQINICFIINFFVLPIISTFVITTPDRATDINGLTSNPYKGTGSSSNGFYQ